MQLRVYYEDTDAGGIVYHSKYLNFCERARSEMLFSKDLSPKTTNAFFVVRDIRATYLKSATLGEVLEVKTKINSLGKVSVLLDQDIFNNNKEKIFTMSVKLVYLKNSKPSKIDKRFIKIFQQYRQ